MDHSEVKHLPKVDHTPAEISAAARLLLLTASRLEQFGWVQCDFGDAGRPQCIFGALISSGSDGDVFKTAKEALRDNLGGVSPMIWNDRPERTKDEVVAKLRAVALGL